LQDSTSGIAIQTKVYMLLTGIASLLMVFLIYGKQSCITARNVSSASCPDQGRFPYQLVLAVSLSRQHVMVLLPEWLVHSIPASAVPSLSKHGVSAPRKSILSVGLVKFLI